MGETFLEDWQVEGPVELEDGTVLSDEESRNHLMVQKIYPKLSFYGQRLRRQYWYSIH